MSCLHLVGSRAGLDACLTLCGDGDAVVLLGDGCYDAARLAASPRLRCFALDDDVVARGLGDRLPEAVVRVDHGGLVALVVDYPRSVSWH